MAAQRNIAVLALLGVIAVGIAAFFARGGVDGGGLKYFAGALVGGLAGFALYHAAFGFTGAWRRMTREKRGRGLRAQMLLIGVTCAVTYLMIGYGQEAGLGRMYPVVIGMGLSSAFGALIFGIGMQLGGGCASGTLFTAGGGSTRMVIVLVFFVLGSVLGTAHMTEFWLQLPIITGIPNIPGTSIIRAFGPIGAIAAILGFCAAVVVLSRVIERRHHGDVEDVPHTQSLLRGRWSLWAGALALAAVSVLCFLIFSRPWGVTSAFALWGAKIFQGVGIDVSQWGYWQGWRQGPLNNSVFADRTSVMNFGILFGAFAAAALAGKFRPTLRLSGTDILTAVIGGLLMGYGARLAYGCNIGAFLGGIVSGSMHGFWWLLWGFLGSLIGIRLRALLSMDPPLPARPAPA